MQFIEFRNRMKDFTVFSLADIKAIDTHFHRRRLNDWQDKGYIKKVVKGFYLFSDIKMNERTLFEIANKIYAPSYISFEMALSYHGLIPEGVHGITSTTARKTSRFKTSIADFSYRSLKPQLFWGYDLVGNGEKIFKIATPVKALLDFLYIHPSITRIEDFEGLRINRAVFLVRISKEVFTQALDRFSQKRLRRRAHAFWRFMHNA